jgi:hypothetical protein
LRAVAVIDLADARGEPPVEGAPGLRKPITAGWLLRARRERPRHCRAEKGDEGAPFQLIELHSALAAKPDGRI